MKGVFKSTHRTSDILSGNMSRNTSCHASWRLTMAPIVRTTFDFFSSTLARKESLSLGFVINSCFKLWNVLVSFIFELHVHTLSFLKRVKAALRLSSADCPCAGSVLQTTLISTVTMSSTFVNNSLQQSK